MSDQTCEVRVGEFLDAIAARLPEPAKQRSEILAELRDGMFEAIAAHQDVGVPAHAAVELALGEFSDPDTIARSFWPELAAARARRIAVGLLIAAPVVSALWIVAARSRTITKEGGLFDSPAAHAVAIILIAAALGAGLCTIAWTGRATRWLGPRRQAPLLGAIALSATTVCTDLVILSLLSWRLVDFPGTVHRVSVAVAVLASGGRLLLATTAAKNCITMNKAAANADS